MPLGFEAITYWSRGWHSLSLIVWRLSVQAKAKWMDQQTLILLIWLMITSSIRPLLTIILSSGCAGGISHESMRDSKSVLNCRWAERSESVVLKIWFPMSPGNSWSPNSKLSLNAWKTPHYYYGYWMSQNSIATPYRWLPGPWCNFFRSQEILWQYNKLHLQDVSVEESSEWRTSRIMICFT